MEGQGRCTVFFAQNGNIAIVFPIRRRRRLVGRGAARHLADDLAARGGILLARAVHAVKLVIVRYRDIALHRAAVQVEIDILVSGDVPSGDVLSGAVQHFDVSVAVAVLRELRDRFLQGGMICRLIVGAVNDRREILQPFAFAAGRAGAVGDGLAGAGVCGFGVGVVGVVQLGGGDIYTNIFLRILVELIGFITCTGCDNLSILTSSFTGSDIGTRCRRVNSALNCQHAVYIDLSISNPSGPLSRR